MQFSPFSRHLIPLRSKYPPQHPAFTTIRHHKVKVTASSAEWMTQNLICISNTNDMRHGANIFKEGSWE
jgi:hypothetical protein